MQNSEILYHVGKWILQSKSKEDALPSGIAKAGEKVIAIKTENIHDLKKGIRRGEILTVESYHFGSYCFKERPAPYDPFDPFPFAGVKATPCYNATSFRIPDETSAQIISFLDEVEASAKACCKQIFKAVEAYQPVTQLKLFSSRKDFEAFLNEYDALIMQFDLLLKERIESLEQENLLFLLRNCQAKEEKDAFSLNANSSLEGVRFWFRESFNWRCEHAFPDSAAWASKSIRDKMLLFPQKIKVLTKLAQSIRESFAEAIYKTHFYDEICNQYAEYIIRYV